MNSCTQLSTTQIIWVLNKTNYGLLITTNGATINSTFACYTYTCSNNTMTLNIPISANMQIVNDIINNSEGFFFISLVYQNSLYTLSIKGTPSVSSTNFDSPRPCLNSSYTVQIAVTSIDGQKC